MEIFLKLTKSSAFGVTLNAWPMGTSTKLLKWDQSVTQNPHVSRGEESRRPEDIVREQLLALDGEEGCQECAENAGIHSDEEPVW